MTVLTARRSARPTSSARRGLIIYLVTVVVLSAPLQIGIIQTGALAEPDATIVWMTGLMLVPTVASVIARIWLREGFSDLGFRRGRRVRPALVMASALPFLVGAVAYGAAWAVGLIELQIPPLGLWLALFSALLLVNLLLATGEELGWRGYLLPHLVAAGVPHPIAISSLIWGLWHVPLVLWGGLVHGGPDPLVSAALLMVTTTALGYVLGRLRMDTGNVWLAAVLHVVWNTVIQTGFDPAVAGAGKALWVGESGIFVVATLVVIALASRRRRSPQVL